LLSALRTSHAISKTLWTYELAGAAFVGVCDLPAPFASHYPFLAAAGAVEFHPVVLGFYAHAAYAAFHFKPLLIVNITIIEGMYL